MKISVLTVPSRHGFLFCRFTPYFRRVSFLSTLPISRRALGFAAILLYKITTLPNGAVSPRKGSLSCRLFAYIHAHGRFGMLPKYCWASFFANDLQTEPGCNSHPGFSLPRSKKSIAGFCQLNLCHCVL